LLLLLMLLLLLPLDVGHGNLWKGIADVQGEESLQLMEIYATTFVSLEPGNRYYVYASESE